VGVVFWCSHFGIYFFWVLGVDDIFWGGRAFVATSCVPDQDSRSAACPILAARSLSEGLAVCCSDAIPVWFLSPISEFGLSAYRTRISALFVLTAEVGHSLKLVFLEREQVDSRNLP